MSSVSPVATLRLSSVSRILPSSCCPDKDLVLLISRDGSNDRISLWKLQGSKRWEIDVEVGRASDEIVDVAWAPDGTILDISRCCL